jgi:hypothetical protein
MRDTNKGEPTNVNGSTHFGLALSKLEESQLMTLITYLHWKDRDT